MPTMDGFLAPLLGGVAIGIAASLLLLTNGRIAGISGIVAGAFLPTSEGRPWRLSFLAGLLVAGLAALLWRPELLPARTGSLPAVAVAGLLVGAGTRLGSGCTSGHGVCGLARLSARSLAATATFIATGAVTVFLLGVG